MDVFTFLEEYRFEGIWQSGPGRNLPLPKLAGGALSGRMTGFVAAASVHCCFRLMALEFRYPGHPLIEQQWERGS
jgi:hypothetical protein